jgi:hypothetical protein
VPHTARVRTSIGSPFGFVRLAAGNAPGPDSRQT